MRYNLGHLDRYPIEAAGTGIENNPMLKVYFKEPIDPLRLESAVYQAIQRNPLFGTKAEFKREYYLVDNKKPVKIIHAKESERPLTFGQSTNDYLWQCCYYDNEMTLEWVHGVADGNGALTFLKHILMAYCRMELPSTKMVNLVGPGLEPFYDRDEKGVDYKIDPPGFSIRDFPSFKHRGYETDFHFLTADTSEVLSCTKACESSVAPIIIVLFSRALRMHIPKSAKNRNVSCNVPVDLRRILGYETMHNCVDMKRITYQDRHDDMSFKDVAKEYKKAVDNMRLTPNAIRMLTDRVNTLKILHIPKSRRGVKFMMRLISLIMKHTDCNFQVTYLGKMGLPPEVRDKVDDIIAKEWNDFGECTICCLDNDGRFNLGITENFVEKGVVEDFIKLSRDVGIYWTEIESSVYTQAHYQE